MLIDKWKPTVARTLKLSTVFGALFLVVIYGYSLANPARLIRFAQSLELAQSAEKGMEGFKAISYSSSNQRARRIAEILVQTPPQDMSILTMSAQGHEVLYPELSWSGIDLVLAVEEAIKAGQSRAVAEAFEYHSDDTGLVGNVGLTLRTLKIEDIRPWQPLAQRAEVSRTANINLCKYKEFVGGMCDLGNLLGTIGDILESPRPDMTSRLARYETWVRKQSSVVDYTASFAECAANADICECANALGSVADLKCE